MTVSKIALCEMEHITVFLSVLDLSAYSKAATPTKRDRPAWNEDKMKTAYYS